MAWRDLISNLGTLTINGGATATTNAAVSLAVPATDTNGSGVSLVRVSNDSATTGGVLSSGTTYSYTTSLAWKYAGITYKISLMNAGVAIQSLYLVASDLGLAGAAAGSGNPELFARATGVSSWEETSIAEFGFGRPA